VVKNRWWADPVPNAKMVKSVQHNMRKEYDFGKGVRGKYAKKYKAGANIVLLDPDVARVFKTQSGPCLFVDGG